MTSNWLMSGVMPTSAIELWGKGRAMQRVAYKLSPRRSGALRWY